MEYRQRHDPHGEPCPSDERCTRRRRGARRVSVLAGGHVGQSDHGRRECGRDVQRSAAQRSRWDPAVTNESGRGGGNAGVPAQRRVRQESTHIPIRRPAVPGRGPRDRQACHQQAGRVSSLAAEQRHHENTRRQPGRDLSASGPRVAVEGDCDVRRQLREAAARHAESADRRFLRSDERPGTDHVHRRKRPREPGGDAQRPLHAPRAVHSSVVQGTRGTTSASRRTPWADRRFSTPRSLLRPPGRLDSWSTTASR